MTFLSRALAATFCLALPLAAQVDFKSYLQTRFPGSAPSARKFLRAAKLDGHLRTRQDRARAKRAWIEAVGGGRLNGVRRARRTLGSRGIEFSPNALAVSETEYNATRGFATDGGVVTTTQSFDGNIAANGETDTWRFRMVFDGRVQMQLNGRGSSPIPSGDFALYNERGYLIRLAEGSTSPASMQIDLPRGVYFVTIEAPSAGDYSLQVGVTSRALTALPLSGTSNVQLSTSLSVFRFDLPVDGVYDLRINGGTLDSYLFLSNGEFSYMLDVDDDSRSTGTDAGLLAHLPKGSYIVEVDADSAGPATFTSSFTPRAVPPLACNGSVAGTIPGGEEDFLMYRVVNTATQDLTFTILPRGGASAITDSYLWLFDASSSGIMESDDDFAFVGSAVQAILPAATYYVSSSGYWDFGDYTIAAACRTGTPTPAPVGTTTSGNIAANDGSVTFLAELGTPAPLEFQVFENLLPDAQLGIVDAGGVARGFDDDALFGIAGSEVSGAYGKGQFHVIVKEYSGDTGSFDLMVGAPKFRASAGNRLRGLGSAGDFAVLVASAATIPGVAITPFGGFFQLDLAQGFVVGPILIPAGGELDFGFAFPTMSGAVLQSLHLNVTTLGGDFTNVLR